MKFVWVKSFRYPSFTGGKVSSKEWQQRSVVGFDDVHLPVIAVAENQVRCWA